jgi:hypothetical protein
MRAARNVAFWRALHSLSHGVCVLAIVTLLLNDHFLRVYFPSWVTGKLGDFAWLVFAPFICALACAWLAPVRVHERGIGIGAFVFIGAWFALAKTTALIHGWTIAAYGILMGYHGTLRLDPSDLLALPALWLGWKIWSSADSRRETVKPRVWLLLTLGVMATVATSVANPLHGIVHLCAEGTTLYAFEYPVPPARAYRSEDGGLTWVQADVAGLTGQCGSTRNLEWGHFDHLTWKISDGVRLYHESPADKIESSLDNGSTWTPEIDLAELRTEVRDGLYRRERGTNSNAGPQDAVVSEQGNLVVAMGTDGVLVRKRDGIWQWVPAGPFHFEQYGTADRLALLIRAPDLAFQDVPVVLAVFVVLSVLTIGRPITTSTTPHLAFFRIAWILFAVSWLPTPVAAVNFVLPLLVPIGAVLAVFAGIKIYRIEPRALLVLSGLCAGTSLLFVFPFFLWAFDTVPYFFLAQIYALGIGASAVITSRLYIRRKYSHLFLTRT